MAKNSFILSDESKNSYGFIVDTTTLNLQRFQNNPVMLYLHDQERHIGKWDNVRVDGVKLMADPDIDTEDTLGADINRKVDKGYLKGASIGINIGKFVKDADGTPRAMNCEVTEASICPLPSNGSALRVYDTNGAELSETQIKTMLSAITTKTKDKNSDMKISEDNLKALGLTADATEEQINTAIEAKLKAAPANPAPDENEGVKKLSARLEKIEEQAVEAVLDAAETAGRILAAQRSTYEARLKADFDAGKKEINELPVRTKLGSGVKAKKNPNEELKFDELRKTREGYAQLMEIKREDPERYKELVGASSAAEYLKSN